MYGSGDIDPSEVELRRRIRNAFAKGRGSLHGPAVHRIEDSVLALMKAYFHAPVQKRQAVYEEQAEQLVEIINGSGLAYLPRRSSKVREG